MNTWNAIDFDKGYAGRLSALHNIYSGRNVQIGAQ